MIFDLHVHTTISSCSQLTVEEILLNYKRKGLDGVCITDHDTMAVGGLLEEGRQENGACLIFGMEYATSEGDFLLFGPFEHIKPNMPASELLPYVREKGGVAVAAHPCRKGRSTSEDILRQGMCTIMETVNGRNSALENQAANNLLDKYGAVKICGSDAHSLDELGKVKVKFHVPINSRADFIQALKDNAFSSHHD